MMNKITLLLFAFVCLLSCNKQAPPPLTTAQVQQHIDSVLKVRIREVDDRAQKDLEHRIKIEVKIKADSILQVMRQGSDTAKTTTTPPSNH